MKGVLDRIEDGLAVILVEDAGNEFTVRQDELPVDSKEGTLFKLDYTDGKYTISSIDTAETERAQEKSALLLRKAQQKKKQSKFKRR